MCRCTPAKRTPWCGKPGCKKPSKPEYIALANKVGEIVDKESPTRKKVYPKYESHCCGAPVHIEPNQKVKYFCTECSEPCIARQKK